MEPAPEMRRRGLLDVVLGPRESRLPCAILATVALASPLVERVLGPPLEDYPNGDHALLELCVRLAAEGSQRLGPEARFHFQHPGPAPFYFAVPFYEWLGRGAASLGAAALAWNLAALFAFVRGASRLARGGALWAALLASVFLGTRGLGFLLSFWNANLPLLPFAAALMASARLATGDARALPVLALFASLAVQAHAVYLVPVGCVTAAGLALFLLPRLRGVLRLPATGSRVRAPQLVTTLAVLAILWWLPLYDEWTGDYHNLSRMLSTGAHPRASPWTDALAASCRALLGFASVRWSGSSVSSGPLPFALALLLLTALALAGRRARRRGAATAAVAVTTVAAVLAVVLTARAAPGALVFPYVLAWASFVGIAAAWVALAEWTETSPRVLSLVAGAPGTLVLTMVGFLLVLAQVRGARDNPHPPREQASLSAEQAAGDTCRELEVFWRGLPVPARPRFLLRVGSGVDRDAALGLILALDKARLRFAVEPFGPYRLDGRLRPDGSESGELHVGEVAVEGPIVPISTAPGLPVAWQPAAAAGAVPDPGLSAPSVLRR